MIPKICYLIFYLFLALVAASPVGKTGGSGQTQSKYKEVPTFNGLGDLKVKEMAFTRGSKFNGYVSHLELDSSDVTDGDIAGLAEAAWWEMFKMARKDTAKLNKIPTVMTALKVGKEVFLASSLKGGGYIYSQEGLSKLANNPSEQREKKDEFTSVLRDNAVDVMNALINCREESIGATATKTTNALVKRGTGQGQRNKKGGNANKNKDQKSSTGQKQSSTGQGQHNTKGSNTNQNQDQQSTPGQGQSSSTQGQSSSNQGHSSTDQRQSSSQDGSGPTGESNKLNPSHVKHKNEGACGEIMASLEYYLLNKEPTKSLNVLKERPTVVAWAEQLEKADQRNRKVPTGKVLRNGGIKPPCDNTIWSPKDPSQHGTSRTDADGCGEDWGCKAFTGQKGMNFHVVPEGTTSTYLSKSKIHVLGVPTFPVPK